MRLPLESDIPHIKNEKQLIKSITECEEYVALKKKLEYIQDFKYPNIKYRCSVGSSGYAIAAKNNIKYLLGLGFNIMIEIVSVSGKIDEPNDDERMIYSLSNRKLDYDIVIHHCIPERWMREKDKKNIGFIIFEFHTIPSKWMQYISSVDKVFCICQHNMIEAKRKLSVPVLLFRTPIYPIRRKDHLPNNIIKFYFIGENNRRKAIDELINIFLELHNMRLYVKTNRFHRDDWRVKNGIISHKNITIDIRELSSKDMENIHYNNDCFISLSRGEACGLPACEACVCGNELILTDCPGHNDYISLFHRIKTEESKINMCQCDVNCQDNICKEYKWLNDDLKWYEPDINSIKENIMNVYGGKKIGSFLSNHKIEIEKLL